MESQRRFGSDMVFFKGISMNQEDRDRKTKYNQHINSWEWKATRQLVLKRDGNQCTSCSEKTNLHVHHLTYDRFGNELLDDLLTLCENCHRVAHGRKPLRKKRTVGIPKRNRAKVKPRPKDVARMKEVKRKGAIESIKRLKQANLLAMASGSISRSRSSE